jgi:hypothetical protein
LFDFSRRFTIGINVDDAWRYADARVPKSILVPHLLSLDLPVGNIIDRISEVKLLRHGHCKPGSGACLVCERVILSLAEELVDAKIGFVRCWFPWRFFEPAPGPEKDIDEVKEVYERWPMDSFVNILTDHGLGVIPVVACGYQRMLPNGTKVDSDRNEYVKRASIHTRILVRRYKRKIRYWQIENEPNWWRLHVLGGWRTGFSWIDPHGFRIQLLSELNKAVHAEDSTAQTIINLEADTKLDSRSFAPFCDVIGLDFYPNYKPYSPIDTSKFKKAKDVANDSGKPIIISETGYPSGPSFLGYTRSNQSEYVRKACLDAFALDSVNGIGLWRYSDTPWRSFPFQENYFGLVDIRGKPKPGWKALSAISRKLVS